MEETEEYVEFSFTMPMTTTIDSVEYDENSVEKPVNSDSRRAVAIIGDRFYRGAFLPASELEKSYKGWENTLHDINHMGTSHIQGLTATSDILYFIGYNKNVSYDAQTKTVSMDIVHKEDTHYGKAWKAYVDLVTEAGGTPNVSIHFTAKTSRMKAKDLPDGVNYADYGLKKDDYIYYLHDIIPGALSTVFRGACNDKMGCGIKTSHSECESCEVETQANEDDKEAIENEKERQALIAWLEKHKEA